MVCSIRWGRTCLLPDDVDDFLDGQSLDLRSWVLEVAVEVVDKDAESSTDFSDIVEAFLRCCCCSCCFCCCCWRWWEGRASWKGAVCEAVRRSVVSILTESVVRWA